MASLMLLILTPVGGEEGMGVGRNVNGVGGSHDRRNWRDLQLRRWNLKRRSNLKRREMMAEKKFPIVFFRFG